ncbi:MAG: CDP-diacylglycerol--glycerol-3-phosphate 3-phosphatidyltransferase [Lachnospiraceae bacterium]|nr:CDP-diacylglycerol--glycerol-3-phosphate 3-phosphatidyltransferase [Lachnospiraceae bacterium]
MNLPNKLTMLRVAMIPVFVVLFFLRPVWPYSHYAAALVFILASLTDLYDGRIARERGLVTNFGKFADPLADKLLVCTALICLVSTGQIPVWAVILIIAREFIISGFRLVAAEQGVVLAASKIAKVKTTFQMIMTVALTLDFPGTFFTVLNWVLIVIAVVLTVVSLVEYMVKNWNVMGKDL